MRALDALIPRAATLTLVVASALLFAPQHFAGRLFVLGDAAAFRPFSEFSRARWIERRERTHWNPYVFTGISATASLADARPQYLPDAVLDALDGARALPGMPPLALPLAAHLAGMLAVAALAGALWDAGPLARVWAGIGWGLSTVLVVPFAYGHDARFMATALMPVTLLLVHHTVVARRARDAFGAQVGLAGVTGLQVLTGHPQIVYLTAWLAALFAIERAWHARRGRALAAVAAAAALGTAIGAAVWWPGLRYEALSVRGGAGVRASEVAAFSLAWRDLLACVWPWATGFGEGTYWGGLGRTTHPQYLGALVVALAAVGLRGGAARNAGRGAARLLAGVTVFAAAASLGHHLAWFDGALRNLLPLWTTFRVPVATLAVVPLCAGLLAARGLDRILRGRGAQAAAARPAAPRAKAVRASVGRRTAVAGLLAALAIVALIGLAIAAGPLAGAWARMAVAAGLGAEPAAQAASRAGLDLAWRALLGGIVVAALAARLSGWARAGVLVVTLALDLGTATVPFLARAGGAVADLAPPPPPPIARIAAREPEARAMALRRERFFSNDWVSWRARSVAGYHGAAPAAWDDLRRAGALGTHGVMRALAVRYVSGALRDRADTTRYQVVAGTEADPVWRVRGALPRAYTVPRVVALPGAREVLAAMIAPGFDPARIAFTEAPEADGAYAGSAGAALRWIEDQPDRQTLDVEAAAAAFVVIADAHAPGWRARVDGRPAALHRVDHLLRGVAVPAGRHRVALDYTPVGWSAATAVTRWALALWALLAVAWAGAAARAGVAGIRNGGRA